MRERSGDKSKTKRDGGKERDFCSKFLPLSTLRSDKFLQPIEVVTQRRSFPEDIQLPAASGAAVSGIFSNLTIASH